jgi:hypothetical protein
MSFTVLKFTVSARDALRQHLCAKQQKIDRQIFLAYAPDFYVQVLSTKAKKKKKTKRNKNSEG